MSNVKIVPKKKTSRKVTKRKTSRVAEVIKVLNESIEISFAQEIVKAEKTARRKKASPKKRTSQR